MLALLLPFFLGFGDPGPVSTYLRYPSGPLEPLAFEASRTSPWPSDFETSGQFVVQVPVGWVPAPRASDYASGGMLLAQSAVTNEQLERENLELRQRIEALENMLKQQIGQPPVTQPMAAPSTDGMKSVPGWLAEVYGWNAEGRIGEDPIQRILTRSCPFTGKFWMENRNSMYIYTFSSVFRAKEAGRHRFGMNLTCEDEHACVMQFSVDGQRIIDFSDESDGKYIQQGVPLTVGDHQVKFTIYIRDNKFLGRYRPADEFKWEPLVQGPNDFNARNYRTDELFAVIPQSVNSPVQGCNY